MPVRAPVSTLQKEWLGKQRFHAEASVSILSVPVSAGTNQPHPDTPVPTLVWGNAGDESHHAIE